MQQAHDVGFTHAVFLQPLLLQCKSELRAYCNPQECPNHGQNWVCPPGCGTLEECRDKVREFDAGILLQSVTNLTPPTDMETYRRLSTAHNLRFRGFVETVWRDFEKVLSLTTGGCVFCETCSYPKPCRKPKLKMESLSAFGVDVGALCEKAGLNYSFREDMLYLTALLLVK